MKYEITVTEQEKQYTLSVRQRTNLESLPKIIGEAYMKIFGYMAELGLTPKEAPFTAYYNLDMNDLDVEMGFPVDKEYPAKGEIFAGEVPEGKYVTCMHKGPYSEMEKPYNEIEKYLKDNGLETIGSCYEIYYNSPQEVPENELLTKIMMQLK